MSEFNSHYRSEVPELMDQPGVKREEIILALKELEKVNTLLGGYNVTWKGIQSVKSSDTLNIVDYGCGGGDVLRFIYDRAIKESRNYTFTGIDINPVMVEYCKSMNGDRRIDFHQYSIWEDEILKLPCDIAINGLFCHHFDHDELVNLVKRMYAHAKKMVVINDLHRHPLAYHSIRLITKYFSKSYLVKNDAGLSVARSLTRKEWLKVIEDAGIKDFKIEWHWAFRWLIILNKR